MADHRQVSIGTSPGVRLYGHSDWPGFAAIIGSRLAVMAIGWTGLAGDDVLMTRADD